MAIEGLRDGVLPPDPHVLKGIVLNSIQGALYILLNILCLWVHI